MSVASSEGSDGSFGDWESDGETTPAVCLFCDHTHASPATVVTHMETAHNFPWTALTTGEKHKSVYGGLRAINFVRAQVASDASVSVDSIRTQLSNPASALWVDDAFLQPVLPQDALLAHVLASFEEEEEGGEEAVAVSSAGAAAAAPSSGGVGADDDDDDDDVPTLVGMTDDTPVGAGATSTKPSPPPPPPGTEATHRRLIAENQQLKALVGTLQTQLKQSSLTLRSMLDDDDTSPVAAPGVGETKTDPGVDTGAGDKGKDKAATKDALSDDLDPYFESYSSLDIHEEMLKDTVRTQSYRTAILRNEHLFRDKVVLDVGCGTGILSMFAASAGAKHVYGIDRSHMIRHAREIVAENGLQDRITLIQNTVEETELPVDSVDIIISEWMGYFLLYESMLDSVLFARDKWLVEGGMLFPDKMHLYVELANDAGLYKKKEFWRSVYGYKMTSLHKLVEGNVEDPEVHVVDPTTICSKAPCLLREFDLQTVTVADLTFTAPFKLEVEGRHFVEGVVGYFDTTFSFCHPPVSFSTSAASTYTHWKQTTFHLDTPLIASPGEVVEGSLTCHPLGENHRHLGVSLDYRFKGQHQSVDKSQRYRMV